ncbi:MAG: heme biosynthesis HemY N-terminal domain-containing protein [Coxiellaceae bacterium]|nr:heme biosynthesis HemY N-terminal domain-containing protein [Coxiellaceae bacterium]
MRTLFSLFFLLLIAVGLGFLVQKDPGYVVIGYNHWTAATSLWVAVSIIALTFFILYLVVTVLKNIFSIPEYFSHRRFILNLQRYQKYISQGIADLSVGNDRAAEKLFIKLVRKNKHYTTYLLAAQAAQAQQAYDRRDQYLKHAFQLAGNNTFAVSLVQGVYYLQAEQYDESLVILKQLYKQEPKNSLLLKALKALYFKNRDWQSLQLILPQLKKQKLISKEELGQIVTHID